MPSERIEKRGRDLRVALKKVPGHSSAGALNKSCNIAGSLALNKSCNIPPSGGDREQAVKSLSGETALNKVPVHPNEFTLPIEDIASALGLTPQSLMRKHKRLSRDHGFPPPLPGGVWRWSRAAIEAWIRANGARPDETAETDNPSAANDRTSRLVIEQNASLRARYGASR